MRPGDRVQAWSAPDGLGGKCPLPPDSAGGSGNPVAARPDSAVLPTTRSSGEGRRSVAGWRPNVEGREMHRLAEQGAGGGLLDSSARLQDAPPGGSIWGDPLGIGDAEHGRGYLA